MLIRRIWPRQRRGRPARRCAIAALAGRPAPQQALLVGQHLADVDAVGVDAELAQLVGMRAAAHLDHRHHPQQLALNLDVALHDDRVGHEGGAVRRKAQVGVAVFQLRGHQHRHPGAGQRGDQARQRLAEVFAEGRRQGQLKARERVDHDPGCTQPLDLAQQQVDHLVDRQVGRLAVDQADLATVDQVGHQAVARLAGVLLKSGDHAGLAAAYAFDQKGRRQHAFA